MSKYLPSLKKATIVGLLTLSTLASGCGGLVERISERKQKKLAIHQTVAQYVENHNSGISGGNESSQVPVKYPNKTQPVTAQRSFLERCIEKYEELHPRIAVEYDFKRRKETIITPQTVTINEKEYTYDKKEIKKTNSSLAILTLGAGWGEDGGWNNEFFRMYHNTENDGENTYVWTEAAIKRNFIIGNKEGWHLDNECLFFGSVGNNYGYGIQTEHALWGRNRRRGVLTLNADKANIDGTKDTTRVGAGLTFDINPKVRLNSAFDTINSADEKINFLLIGTDFNITKSDRISLAYELEDSDINGKTHTGIGVWTHAGKDESWGTRTFGVLSTNPKQDVKRATVNVEWVQNPKFDHGIGNAVWSRKNGNFRARNVIGNALDIEVAPLTAKSSSGWIAETQVDFINIQGMEDWHIRGDFGHVFNLDKDTTLSILPYGELFTQGANKGHGYGIEFLAGSPDLFVQTKLEKSTIGTIDDIRFYIYIGKSFPPKGK